MNEENLSQLKSVAPEGVKELAEVVKHANQTGVKISTKRAVSDCIYIDLCKLNSIQEIDRDNLVVAVQSGLNIEDFRRQMLQEGFDFPLLALGDGRISLKEALALDVTGVTTASFGKWREFVLGMEVVLPTGQIITVGGKNIKNVSGMDIIALMVGSRTELGIVTKLWLRLLPVPEDKIAMITNFTNIQGASKAVSSLTEAGLCPQRVELIDGEVAKKMGLSSREGEAVVIVQLEGFANSLERQRTEVEIQLKKGGAGSSEVIADREKIEALWTEHFQIANELCQMEMYSLTVLPTRLPALVSAVEEALKGAGARGYLVAHGTAAKLNIFSNDKSPELDAKMKKVAARLGGKMDGTKIVADTHRSEIEALEKGLAQVFDPNKVLLGELRGV